MQVRVLTLHKGENRETTLYRLKKGWTLQFARGPSLQVEDVHIFCNHPPDESVPFVRENYYELEWKNASEMQSDTYDSYAEIKIVCAGSFNYFFTVDGSTNPEDASGQGYVLVDPELYIGKNDDILPMDCIQVHTVVTKSLGTFDMWEDRLRVSKESGYNMIHFTPLQELGYSNSSYSLKDQHKLNSHLFQVNGQQYDFDDVEKLVRHMKDDWDVLSMTDLVFNHSANDSPWLQQHPECAYNLDNNPHLKPAYVLDRILWHVTLDVASGKLEFRDIPPAIKQEHHMQALERYVRELLPKYKLHEFYTVNVEANVKLFKEKVEDGSHLDAFINSGSELQIIQDTDFKRNTNLVDMGLALILYNTDKPGVRSRDVRLQLCCDELRRKLKSLNEAKIAEINGHLDAAVNNFMANVRWRFLQEGGPQYDKVTRKQPLMWKYFLAPGPDSSVELEEEIINTEKAAHIMAHNGWVMNDDPLRNFAEPGSYVYLRRELLVWGDSVKLRYGEKPEDCLYLWKHMELYAIQTARIFHGVRLDNCHSTPIHVAEFLLDAARKVRPDLYVIAELFTSSEHTDNLFNNHLGINSLIREAMSAWDSHEEGRLVYRYGGVPVGAFLQPATQPLVPCVAHALFYDMTHDNPSPVEKRSVFDLMPSAALVSMACCATGSNRGYDEMVPHKIHVVSEKRTYALWTSSSTPCHATVGLHTGILAGKRALNRLHYEMGAMGFNEVFVDQRDYDTVTVTRRNPLNHKQVILVARTAFNHPANLDTGYLPPLKFEGVIEEVILEARLTHHGHHGYSNDPEYINGLPDFHLCLRENLQIYDSEMVRDVSECPNTREIHFYNFPPGSVVAFRVALAPHHEDALTKVHSYLAQFAEPVPEGALTLDESKKINAIISRLSLTDLNRVLYRCDGEERDDGYGIGTYHIPNFGSLVYCGLQGIMTLLEKIRGQNDLGHPLCHNLRDGDWLPGYVANRLKVHPRTKELGLWFEAAFSSMKILPRNTIPCFFDAFVTGTYIKLLDHAWKNMSPFVNHGSTFLKALALGSVQMCGIVKTAPLPLLSPNLAEPRPVTLVSEKTGEFEQQCVTLAAGLPHFSHGIFRNWGRDTFISLRGLLLVTERYLEARYLILAFGACLRHGLLPNLLGEGTHARYNCRDAFWWWLQSVQDYCKMVPNGLAILQDKVSRLYPTDNTDPQLPGKCDQLLQDVIQEGLERHACGVKYRERNAGYELDRDMSTEGFDNEVGVNWETGFVFGGNVHNCGTWMDKMGSSDKAGNKGKPATPRDGSAVELVGLCKSALYWLNKLYEQGIYPYGGVEIRNMQDLDETDQKKQTQETESQRPDELKDQDQLQQKTGVVPDKKDVTDQTAQEPEKITFKEWEKKIVRNFERYFWISTQSVPENEPNPKLINLRGIYKDSHGATQPWADFQLRPNFTVAMVVAPDMFTPSNAWTALDTAEKLLLGPLGMKTLDTSDWAYDGYYVNSDDSHEHKRAKGFNYHNGPEWCWPIGYFLRAKLIFARMMDKTEPGIMAQTVKMVKKTLSKHHLAIQASPWKSLPELTNKNGERCNDSCDAQAWTVACLLDVLYDLENPGPIMTRRSSIKKLRKSKSKEKVNAAES